MDSTGKMFASVDGATQEHWDMVMANMGLVHFMCNKRRFATEEDRADAEQDGMFGLLRAAMKFEPERGFRFSTYACTWIQQFIDRGQQHRDSVKRRQARGHPTEAPLSLDWGWDGADPDLCPPEVSADRMASDEDVAEEVVTDMVIAGLHRYCDDDVDCMVLATMGELGGNARVAERVGVTAQAIRKRRIKLMQRMRDDEVC